MVAAHKVRQIEGLAGGCARSVCHVILQRCAGRDMLDDAAAEAQLAEADELLTAVGFVQYLPRRWPLVAWAAAAPARCWNTA